MIKFVPDAPPNALAINAGFLRARANSGIVAKQLLKMSQGEFVTREIISRLVVYLKAHPGVERQYNTDRIFYSLGEPQTGSDFGTFQVPITIYLQRGRD